VGRARHGCATRSRCWSDAVPHPRRGQHLRAGAFLLALTAASACGQLGTDLKQVVALEVFLPDSGRVEVGDTLRPSARALNGRGDSVAAQVFWSSLDTAIVPVLDSAAGVTLAKTAGTGRLQARAGQLRSNPQSVVVLVRLDSTSAAGPIRDAIIVSTTDTLSASLVVKVWAGPSPAPGRSVVYAMAIYPASDSTVTLVPKTPVQTDANGIAFKRVRFKPGPLPDSVVVTAAVRRPNGTDVPGSPVRFVVEFRP
jgi:hypothetical protein